MSLVAFTVRISKMSGLMRHWVNAALHVLGLGSSVSERASVRPRLGLRCMTGGKGWPDVTRTTMHTHPPSCQASVMGSTSGLTYLDVHKSPISTFPVALVEIGISLCVGPSYIYRGRPAYKASCSHRYCTLMPVIDNTLLTLVRRIIWDHSPN